MDGEGDHTNDENTAEATEPELTFRHADLVFTEPVQHNKYKQFQSAITTAKQIHTKSINRHTKEIQNQAKKTIQKHSTNW